jgi:hypothetical protein
MLQFTSNLANRTAQYAKGIEEACDVWLRRFRLLPIEPITVCILSTLLSVVRRSGNSVRFTGAALRSMLCISLATSYRLCSREIPSGREFRADVDSALKDDVVSTCTTASLTDDDISVDSWSDSSFLDSEEQLELDEKSLRRLQFQSSPEGQHIMRLEFECNWHGRQSKAPFQLGVHTPSSKKMRRAYRPTSPAHLHSS